MFSKFYAESESGIRFAKIKKNTKKAKKNKNFSFFYSNLTKPNIQKV
jgi:hypothetical protein